MGNADIYYCQTCGVRVPPSDVISGAALVIPGQNRIFCKNCSSTQVHEAPTETDLRPLDPSRDLLDVVPVARNERRSSRSMIPAQRSGDNLRATPPPAKAPMVAIVSAAVMVLIAAAIFFFSSRQNNPPATTGTATATDAAVGSGKAVEPARTKIPTNTFKVGRAWGPICVLAYDEPDSSEKTNVWLAQHAFARFTPWQAMPEMMPDPLYADSFATYLSYSPLPLLRVETPANDDAMPEPLPPPALIPSEVVLAKVEATAFSGGRMRKDIGKKGIDARIIFGQKTPETATSARFDLKLPTKGPATVLLSTLRLNKDPCAYSVGINGHSIFQGSEAGKVREWIVQTITVPAGIIQGGRNEVRIVNMDPSGNFGLPEIVVRSVEVRGNPPAAPVIVPLEAPKPTATDATASAEAAFPPILDATQRAELQTIDNVFASLSKYDIDTSLRLAQTDTSPAGKQLAALMTQAQSVFNKAIAAINKGNSALTVQANTGKLNVSGKVERIEGGKAWLKDRGLEISVELSALPPEIFFKALAANDSTPGARLEKALLSIATGNITGATALLRKATGHAASAEPLALLNRYAQLTQLQKFESDVNEVSAAIKDGQLPEAAAKLKALQQANPELAKVHKERLAYLASKTETKK